MSSYYVNQPKGALRINANRNMQYCLVLKVSRFGKQTASVCQCRKICLLSPPPSARLRISWMGFHVRPREKQKTTKDQYLPLICPAILVDNGTFCGVHHFQPGTRETKREEGIHRSATAQLGFLFVDMPPPSSKESLPFSLQKRILSVRIEASFLPSPTKLEPSELSYAHQNFKNGLPRKDSSWIFNSNRGHCISPSKAAVCWWIPTKLPLYSVQYGPRFARIRDSQAAAVGGCTAEGVAKEVISLGQHKAKPDFDAHIVNFF